MKIAVLISGEYRTFTIKSMSFLHQPNVDVATLVDGYAQR
jgi:hypothetical protein